jgi:hypothetical protein
MNTKHLIWCLTSATWIVTSASGAPLRAQNAHHAGDAMRGPLPEAVRQATERFRDVKNAMAAGYVQNGGCVSGPDGGAMGVHFANFPLFDDVIDVQNPEVLVYEPRNGRLHLVAAEYVVPGPAWDPFRDPSDKPHLMGHLYQFLPGPNRYAPFQFYELHVWAWKDNPKGSFADWNPKASCVSWEGTP